MARRSAQQGSPIAVETAVRAYVPRTRARTKPPRVDVGPTPTLVFDTETTTDAAQALIFGSYRVHDRDGRLLQEGLVRADDLGPSSLAMLEAYVRDHAADNGTPLALHSRASFVEHVLWPVAYKARAVVVGFNLPFDLSRIAVGWRASRSGGFSLRLWEGVERGGKTAPHQYRPEVTITPYGPRRAFLHFTAPPRTDRVNRDHGRPYRGRFLDCHTLAFALSDRSLTLDGACRLFGVGYQKRRVERHGDLTEPDVDYNRHDTRLTWRLFERLRDELARHPIDLAPERAASPASIAKGYLRTTGIVPPPERGNAVSDRALGAFSVAYNGGRAECRIRRTPVPVRSVDFTSMYPTVFALQGLWSWVTAARFTERDATHDARAYLEAVTRETLLSREAWPALVGVVCRIRPDDDLVPVRARYGGEAGAWTIGLNHLTSPVDRWYSLADIVAAKLLSGTAPEILEAIAVVPEGVLPDLRPVTLGGVIAVDPSDDLFRRAIEERQATKATDPRLAAFLKTLANSGAYGIFAEYHRRPPRKVPAQVCAYGLWPIETSLHAPEEPGSFCWPPLATSVTAAARLLLALLQASVEVRGGTYAACDTDSLLVVSNEHGGHVRCPGGYRRLPDHRAAVRALSWAELDDVLAGLNALNPYKPDVVPSLVKLEDENFERIGTTDDGSRLVDRSRPVELLAFSVSAKRYVLYERQAETIKIRKASNHGLGLYRSPLPREAGDWIEDGWRDIVASAEGLASSPAREWHAWPAVGQLPVSSPRVLRTFREAGGSGSYAQSTKPYGFLLVGHADPLAPLPAGVSRPVIPVAPFSSEAGHLLDLPWVGRRTGARLAVTTRPDGEPDRVRLRTYGDVLAEYRAHAETKSGDPRGGRGTRASQGLLPRLHLRSGAPVHIGRESNQLEDEEEGALTEADDPYVEYRDERREWEAVLPALRELRQRLGWRAVAETSGLSERALRYALNGGKFPRALARQRLLAIIAQAKKATLR
jgi:hypothetical protein